jgi:hypothetical protein
VVELSKAKRAAPVGEVEMLREMLAVQQARIQELEALVPKPRRAKSKR